MPVEAPPELSPQQVEEAIREIERYLAAAAAASAPFAPWTIVGWAGAIAAAGALAWLAYQATRRHADEFRTMAQRWADNEREKRALIASGQRLTAAARHYLQQGPRASGDPMHGTAGPSAIVQGTLALLKETVARIRAWITAHRNRVHLREARAWRTLAATVGAYVSAVTHALDAAADALRDLYRHHLPRLRQALRAVRVELERVVRWVRREVVPSLEREIRAVRLELARVVRWIAREVIPRLERALEGEAQARQRADRALLRQVQTETQAREQADEAILAQLAPVIAWVDGPGQHVARKVRTHEDWLDQLARTDVDWAAMLLIPPHLQALVVHLLEAAAPASVRVLAGLEEAAARALGAV